MKYPEIVEAEKRDPIRTINWPWLVVWLIAGAVIGVLVYFAGRI